MRIIAVRYIKDYQLEITFANKVTRTVDLKDFLQSAKNPMTAAYRDLDLFRKVKVTHGHLSWGEMDLSGETLYSWESKNLI